VPGIFGHPIKCTGFW